MTEKKEDDRLSQTLDVIGKSIKMLEQQMKILADSVKTEFSSGDDDEAPLDDDKDLTATDLPES